MITMTKLTTESASSPRAAASVRQASHSNLSSFLRKNWGSREDVSKSNSSHTKGPSVSTAGSTNANFVPRSASILKSSEPAPVNANPDRLTALWGGMSDETRSTLMKNLQSQLAVPKKVETEVTTRKSTAQHAPLKSASKLPSSDSAQNNERGDIAGPLPARKVHAVRDDSSEGRTPSYSSDSMKSLLQRKIADNKLKDGDQQQNSKYHSSTMRMIPKKQGGALLSSQSHCNFSTKSTLQRRKSSKSVMKKCVSFEENPVQSVQAFDTCETELKNSVWYSDQEYTGMKNSIKRVLREQKSGDFEETESSTMHGLEMFLNRRELKEKRKEAISAVIFEQARQRIKRIPSDPMLLAEAYRSKLGGTGSKSCSNMLTKKLVGSGPRIHRSSSYSVDLAQVGGAMQNAAWGKNDTSCAPDESNNTASELRMKFMQGAV